ncbi:hypothetical protein FOXYS1_12888 [Fusarium oxysporum]|uniref:Uncharacterized protein n=1 Tax=Fusarium oxysporum TaxID=5507 RepID=A0A8H5EDH4_FUSOX|nr:hypothetical protein FOXYS1_12888 [Fusarium oxysporum]
MIRSWLASIYIAPAIDVKVIKPPPEMARMKAGKDIYFERQAKAEMGSSVDKETLSLPGAQFGTYHLKHRRETFGPQDNDQPSLDLLVFRRQLVLEKLETLAEKLKNNFGALFEDKVPTIDYCSSFSRYPSAIFSYIAKKTPQCKAEFLCPLIIE